MKKPSTYVFLPTNNATHLAIAPSGKLDFNNTTLISKMGWQNQHLYILSEEGISDGDWILHKNQVHKVRQNRGLYLSVYELSSIDIRTDLCKKVIATTDPELWDNGFPVPTETGIGKISQSDIEYIISLHNGGGKGVDVRDSANRLSNITKKLHNRTDEYCEGARDGFILGYNQCLTDNADKFTLEDMQNLWNDCRNGVTIEQEFNNYIKSLTKHNRDTIMVEYEEFTEEGHQIVTAPRLKLQGGCIVISRG